MKSLSKHLLKTITYRLFGSLMTVLIVFLFGGSKDMFALGIVGISDFLLKPLLYFLHERIWWFWETQKGNDLSS